MATMAEMEARVTAALAAVSDAEKAGDAAAELAAVDALEAAEKSVLAARSADRKLAGKRLERAARAASAGKYQVAFYDLASPFPQLDPEKIPAGGVVVFRGATLEVRKEYEGIVAADGVTPEQQFAASVTMLCDCTILPVEVKTGPAGIGYRLWWENDGRGLVNLALLEVGRLGGFQFAAFQRAKG